MIFTAKLVQMSAMCKKKTDFLFAYSRVQPNLSKITASRAQMQKNKHFLFFLLCRGAAQFIQSYNK